MGRKSREKRERRAQQNHWLDDDRRTAVATTLVAANGAPIIPTVRGAGQALDEAA
jgi:CRISPR/Cas system-associated endonuclease Cas1